MKLPPLRLARANFWPKKIHPSCQILTNLALCALRQVDFGALATLPPHFFCVISGHLKTSVYLSHIAGGGSPYTDRNSWKPVKFTALKYKPIYNALHVITRLSESVGILELDSEAQKILRGTNLAK